MRSTRFSFRGRTRDQRGYVLISAIVLAVLYFMLMELMLMESSRALVEAQRFRSRIVALTLAENAAELASRGMVDTSTPPPSSVDAEDADGKMTGSLTRTVLAPTAAKYEISGEGTAMGVQPMHATVQLQGRILNNRITIDYAYHSQ